ncbi:MAG: hypothetical protein HQ581_28330 [Planctomycetes bacterium]|nr:hypothetical protein [Planctomycetota bacterium]
MPFQSRFQGQNRIDPQQQDCTPLQQQDGTGGYAERQAQKRALYQQQLAERRQAYLDRRAQLRDGTGTCQQ